MREGWKNIRDDWYEKENQFGKLKINKKVGGEKGWRIESIPNIVIGGYDRGVDYRYVPEDESVENVQKYSEMLLEQDFNFVNIEYFNNFMFHEDIKKKGYGNFICDE